jgi:hypothetical protein
MGCVLGTSLFTELRGIREANGRCRLRRRPGRAVTLVPRLTGRFL